MLSSPRSIPISTACPCPELPGLTQILILSSAALPPVVRFKVSWTAQQTVHPCEQKGMFTLFFFFFLAVAYPAASSHWARGRRVKLLLEGPLMQSNPEAANCAGWRLFWVSRVAQSGLHRPQDVSHHFWNYISGWFISLFVKSGDSIFTWLLICIEYKALRVRLGVSCIMKSMLLQLFSSFSVF